MIYLHSAGIVLVFFLVWFGVCVQQKNYGLVDVAWGLGMSAVALYLLLVFKPNLQVSLSLLLVIVWGLRLGIYLGKRNWGKPEDYRYVNMRKRWGTSHAYLKAFLNVFVLQGVLLYVMMLSSMIAVANPSTINMTFMIMGQIVALFGLAFEVIGDHQLMMFKRNPENKGKLIKHGLWSITRHPNYFGEVVFWWGVFLSGLQANMMIAGIVSPLLITLLINKVSGIPLLERKYADREDYQEYASQVSRMIPYIGTRKISK